MLDPEISRGTYLFFNGMAYGLSIISIQECVEVSDRDFQRELTEYDEEKAKFMQKVMAACMCTSCEPVIESHIPFRSMIARHMC